MKVQILLLLALLAPRQGEKPAVDERLASGMAALHDYSFDNALAEFRAVQESDRDNVMAVWGEAMTHFRPLWLSVNRQSMREVLAKLGETPFERAKHVRSTKERLYLAALEALLAPADDEPARRAFAHAVEAIARHDPEDPEARAFLAHSLFGLWPRGLPDDASLERIAALAESVLARVPDHPGGLHYLVHALDSPDRAWRALPAARRYAKVASRDSSHALHMPSHTFLQLGLFDEAISSNEASFASSERFIAAHGRSKGWLDFHAIDFLLYARLQKGRWMLARRILDELDTIQTELGSEEEWFPGFVASKRSVYLVETEDWERFVLELEDAAARGLPRRNVIGAAGISAIERRDLEHAASFVDACRGSEGPPPAEPSGESLRWSAACDMLEGYLLVRRGDADAGVALLRQSVETVSRVPAWETPDPVKPPAELLGEVYLELGKSDAAAVAFRRALERRPNRFRALLGLSRAEPNVGAHEAALLELLSDADESVRARIEL